MGVFEYLGVIPHIVLSLVISDMTSITYAWKCGFKQRDTKSFVHFK